MNTNRVKQLFVEFAQKLPAPEMDTPDGKETSGRPQILKGPTLVRGNLVLREETALEYLQMLDKVSEIVAVEGAWSRASIDDLLAESVFHVATAKVSRAEAIRAQADRIV